MYSISVTHARDAYLPQLQELADAGEPVDVRGRNTLEIMNYVTEIKEPQHHCILLPSRRWNPWLALSEALWILAGRDDIAPLLPYNSHIRDYSDDGVHLYGAYGKRIYDQIDDLIERLKKDPSDRRAVLQIWDSMNEEAAFGIGRSDLTVESKDPPCNNLLYFKLRDNKLHMTVICRSNDIHFGLYAVNIPTFGILQEYIAARLGVDLGYQTHLSNSLHVYTDDKRAIDITDRMLYTEKEDKPFYPNHELAFTHWDMIPDHETMAEWCSRALEGNISDIRIPRFLIFANDFLRQYRDKTFNSEMKLPYWNKYFDWIMAGELFVKKMWK